MIRTSALEDQMRQQRLGAKTLDNLFRRRIEAGANAPPSSRKRGEQRGRIYFWAVR